MHAIQALALWLSVVVAVRGDSGCVNTQLIHANASGSQVIRNFAAPLNPDKGASLTISMAIYESTENYTRSLNSNTDSKLAEVVRRAIWLDTYPAANLSAEGLPYQGCSVAWFSDIIASSTRGPGDCSSVIDTSCVNAIIKAVNQSSYALSITNQSVSSDACLLGITNIPAECSAYKSRSTWSGQWAKTGSWL
jgi:hypothetical protein